MGKRSSSTDIVFATSRDGLRFERPVKDAFILPGLDPAAWGNRANYAAYHIVPTSAEEISIYASGGRRYTLRTDGFMSIHAPLDGGEILTKPLVFEGKKLILNFATSAAGEIKVELQDAHGTPIPGFTLADAKPLIGDAIKGGSKVGRQLDNVPTSGGGGRLNFGGEGEAPGFRDVVTDSQWANGRALTSEINSGSATDIFSRFAPVNTNTIPEMVRLSQPGTRITLLNTPGTTSSQAADLLQGLGGRGTITLDRVFEAQNIQSGGFNFQGQQLQIIKILVGE
jgi:hypothetical protein